MAVNQPFDIVGSYKESDSSEFDPQQLINLFVDSDPEGRNGKALYPTPGLDLDAGVSFGGSGKGRKLYVFGDFLYAVVGENIYAINDTIHFNKIGSINTQSGYVGLADNGIELMIVDGTGGWIWNPTTSSFTQISAGGFPQNPTDVTILGNRFITNNAETNKLHFSDPGDGLSWNALDEFAITSQPDIVVGLRRLNDRLFIMGERITEVWYDAGEPVLPYRRSDVLPYGCISPGSIAEGFSFLIWQSKTDRGVGSTVMTTGTTPQPVSTKQIDKELERYTITSDAQAFIYRNEQGHTFYQISFTNANKTWAFDISENRWLRLEYNSADRHLAQDHAFFANKHYVLDYLVPNLYELSTLYFTDNGVNLRRLRVSPVLSDKTGRRITLNSLLFDLKQGVGTESGPESDPLLRLRVSRDGGITYGNELSTGIGKSGERTRRSQFFRLGQARNFVFEIKYDNDTPFILLGASVNIDVEQGGF